MLAVEFNNKVKVRFNRRRLLMVAKVFSQQLPLTGQWYFSLALVGDKEMHRLNQTYRHKDRTTDVLSFAEGDDNFIGAPGDKKYLGEVVISWPTAKKQAKEYKCSVEQEIIRLLVHGLAHLAGYDHENVSAAQAREMVTFEERVRGAIEKISNLKLQAPNKL